MLDFNPKTIHFLLFSWLLSNHKMCGFLRRFDLEIEIDAFLKIQSKRISVLLEVGVVSFKFSTDDVYSRNESWLEEN